MHTVLRMIIRLMCACLLSCASGIAQRTIHVPADQTTIQAAIDMSAAGDTVLVAPGTYYENLDFHGHNITVTSEQGAASTILDGSQRGPTVSFQTGETSSAVLSGFTIRNGSVGTATTIGAGGAYIQASPTVAGNTFTDNFCNAVFLQGSAHITGNIITRTHALSAGTQCEYSGTPVVLYFSYHNPFALVSSNTIAANTESHNGVILLWNSDYAAISNNFIHNNNASVGCAAAICLENTTAATISGNDVEDNSGVGIDALIPQYGGTGNVPYGPPRLVIVSNTFVHNTGSSQVDAEGGGGRTLIANNLFSGLSQGLFCTTSAFNQAPPVVQFNDAFVTGIPYSEACSASTQEQNLTSDPQLASDAAGHSVPQADAIIDAGNDSILPQPDTDLAGSPRAQSASAPVHIGIGALEHPGAATQPQARLAIAPSQYQVVPGQSISVTAALVNTGPAVTSAANLKLYLDNALVQTASIVPGTSVVLGGIPIAAGVHQMYATTDAAAPLAATRTPNVVLSGAEDPYSGSGQSVVMDISPATMVGSNIFGQVQCHLSAAGTAAGVIRIYDNGMLLGAPGVSGAAIAQQTFAVVPGPHIYQCDFEGNFTSSIVGVQTVSPVPTPPAAVYSLFSQPDPSEYGDPVTIGGSATPYSSSLNASVLITEGTSVILNTPLSGTGSASITTSSLTPGVHTFVGVFTAQGVTPAGSGGTFTQTVHFAPTHISLTATPVTGSTTTTPITLAIATASSYSGVPVTGSVTLLTGITPLTIAGVLNGTVTLPAGTLPAGTSILTATYNGTAIFAPSTSAAVLITLAAPPPPDFSIAPSNPSLTLRTESHGAVNLTLRSLNGFDGSVNLSCSNLPPIASCTFLNAVSRVSPGTDVSVSLVLETSAVSFFKSSLNPSWTTTLAACLAPMLLLGRRRKLRIATLTTVILATAALLTLAACSGKYPDHVPPGTYNVNIVATNSVGSTTLAHSVPFTVTVTP